MTYKLLKDGEVVNTIVGSADFVTAYCEAMGYTFEEVPEEPAAPAEPEPTFEEAFTNAIEKGLTV